MEQRPRARIKIAAALLAAITINAAVAAQANEKPDETSRARGKYLVSITGCNDCHTAGYTLVGGKIPVEQWLQGSDLGWRGPWGTTYPTNLRLYMQTISEDQWVTLAHTAQMRPPMPWFALHDMSERDLRDMYRFIKQLGAAGSGVPAYLPPEQVPTGPYVQFPAAPK